ncbi:MAG: acyl-CoA thioesterase [Syntrophales bacterium]|jgi:acyl-CoA thioester hydrolase|nr:acyl-CoA thioesterase [Syntrophales bacterium]MCK9528628.1 acyl-CoA thioesterase [Syntrophales bacterium]MDX9923069.1 thioesterase family protein [Syntrophales bacterium]
MAKNDFVFHHRRRIEYADLDGQAIVFFGNYLKYFDTAITEYLRSLGFDYGTILLETGHDVHVVKASVEFKEPVRFDEIIDIHVRAARLGRSSLTFALEIYCGAEEVPRVTGDVVWVTMDQKTRRPAPVPEALVVRLAEMEGSGLDRG